MPQDTRLYVIGDVHGCLHLLDALFRQIADDAHNRPVATASIVLLGDYIDRGPDSRGVLLLLARRELPLPYVALRGNHEDMFTAFLNDASYMMSWRHFGGLETLHSFGIDVRSMLSPEDFERARGDLLTQLPQEIVDFLGTTGVSYETDTVFFCHAGVRPGIPLSRQDAQDLMWIREEFLGSTQDHGKLIVHGHTPVEEPDVRANRINIDTGAYLSGTLTALVLESDGMRFLST